jgi:hypothetical protein
MGLFVLVSASQLSTVEDLSAQYSNIFKTGNRNAASHLWASYIFNRSASLSKATISTLFRGFCPVSGSPIPDRPYTSYHVSLPTIGGGNVTGITHHCCWPCICDMEDRVRVDTKKISAADGAENYAVLVIGDPCTKPEELEKTFQDPFSGVAQKLSDAAPEVKCVNGKLVGAVYSDGGYPIIGMIYTDSTSLGLGYQEASKYDAQCLERKRAGYNSGMGLIFHLVASISPISAISKTTGLVAQLPRISGSGARMSTLPLIGFTLVSLSIALALVLRLRKHTGEPTKQEDSDIPDADIGL